MKSMDMIFLTPKKEMTPKMKFFAFIDPCDSNGIRNAALLLILEFCHPRDASNKVFGNFSASFLDLGE
jgi:hypothetical protein